MTTTRGVRGRVAGRPAVRLVVPWAPSWSEAAWIALRWVGLFVVLAGLVAQLPAVLGHLRTKGAGASLPVVVLGAAQAVMVWHFWHSRSRWTTRRSMLWAVLVLLTSALGLWLASVVTPPAPVPAAWWPVQHLYTLGMYLLGVSSGSLIGWAGGLGSVGLGCLTIYGHWMGGPAPERVQQGLLQMGTIVAVMATAHFALRGIERYSRAADQALAAEREAVTAQRRDARAAQVLLDSRRFIHDEVMHTLRAIAMDRHDVHGQQARRAAKTLDRRLVHPANDTTGSTTVDLAALLRAIPTSTVDVTFVGRGRAIVARPVARTILDAVSECLRNVERHSGSDRATVEVRRRGAAVEVTVRDDGRGFDPAAIDPRRHGLRDSIVARMEGIGGRAVVASASGQGTSVTMTWSPKGVEASGQQWHWDQATARDLIDVALLMCAPIAVWGVIVAAIVWQEWEQPVRAVTAVVAGFALGLGLVLRARTRGLGPVGAAVLALTALGVAMVGTLSTTPGEMSGLNNPSVAVGGVAAVVLVVFRPRREAIVVVALLAALSWWLFVSHMGLAGQPGQYWPMVLGPVQGVVAGLVLRASLDSVGARTLAAQQAQAHAALVADSVAALRGEVAGHLDRVSSATRPFIASVADGTLDVTDEEVRARADRLERVLREDLSLGHAPGVRWAANQLRERGWFVTVHLPVVQSEGGSATPFAKAVPTPIDHAVRSLTGQAISEGAAGEARGDQRGEATISSTTVAGRTVVTVLLLDSAGSVRPYREELTAVGTR